MTKEAYHILPASVPALLQPTTYTENDNLEGKGKIIVHLLVPFPFILSLLINRAKQKVWVECEQIKSEINMVELGWG